MVLSIIFLEEKHKILFHLSIFYEYQQFFQHRICFSIQPQLQLVNLHDKNNERPDNIIMKKLVERANLGHGSL
jgi:hypothetical protein